MTFLGLRSRVVLTSLAVGLCAVLAIATYLSTSLRGELLDRTTSTLENAARLVAERVSAYRPGESLAQLARRLGRQGGVRVTLIAADGRLLGDSHVAPERLASVERHHTREEVREALAQGIGHARRTSTTIGKEMMYVAVPIKGGGPVRVARVAMSLARVDALVDRSLWLIFIGIGVALGVALLASLLMSRFSLRSLSELTAVARSMAAGDYGRRARVLSDDEVGALATNMNRLADTVSSTVGSLADERDLLTAILDGLEEGVLVVSPEGRILRVNPALARALGVDAAAEGRSVAQVEALPAELAAVLSQCLRQGRPINREISSHTLPPRVLLAMASPLGGADHGNGGRVAEGTGRPRSGAADSPGAARPEQANGRRAHRGVVAVFHDITALRRLEAVRRDFVSNVSHELRTPVTALRAAAETLLAGAMNDPERSRSFLEVIHRHAERLTALISDLLDLSRLESGEMQLRRGPVDLAHAARQAMEVVGPAARKKGISLALEFEGLRAFGDSRAVEQVLVNLLDNAVKYTPASGTVTVVGSREDGRVRVGVRDTGSGIEAQHLPRIFERFYRVDPGRSREVGGTGLGLAIVKHLVEVMQGEVRAESQIGKGSIFSFSLPAA